MPPGLVNETAPMIWITPAILHSSVTLFLVISLAVCWVAGFGKDYELLNDTRYMRYFKIVSIASGVLLWFHLGETLGILIRYLPKNEKIPDFDRDIPTPFTFGLYVTQTLVWCLHYVLYPPNRWYFHLGAAFIYVCESITYGIYFALHHDLDIIRSDYTQSVEYVLSTWSRCLLAILILVLWKFLQYKMQQEDEEEIPQAMQNFNPPTTWADFLSHFKKLLPFVWPRGPNTLHLQLMMLGSFLSMIVGRYVNVMVPIQYKRVVDSLSDIYFFQHYSNVSAQVQLLKNIPFQKIGMFVVYRLLAGSSGILGAIQSALWVPIGQFTTKQVSLGMFDHLHKLSLRFHLNRKTGEILRVQDRGVSSIVSLLSSILFNVVPTLADITIACVYFTIQFDMYFGFIVFSTMIAYICVTMWITEWRTKYRRTANQLENAMEAKAVDSLINFETVKYYNAEDFESKMYERGSEYLIQPSIDINMQI
jgi:hypothetical protein